jgi:hypothetical protein
VTCLCLAGQTFHACCHCLAFLNCPACRPAVHIQAQRSLAAGTEIMRW